MSESAEQSNEQPCEITAFESMTPEQQEDAANRLRLMLSTRVQITVSIKPIGSSSYFRVLDIASILPKWQIVSLMKHLEAYSADTEQRRVSRLEELKAVSCPESILEVQRRSIAKARRRLSMVRQWLQHNNK